MEYSIQKDALALAPELTAWRRSLHQMPELGSDLPKTRAFIRRELEALGLFVRECGGGLVAEISGGSSGPVILLRADMDALPMREESGLSFAASGEAAHTCGHDLHAAMLLGAAKLLCARSEMLHGVVRLMFQPDEETTLGAAAMIAAGVLKDVTAAFGLHTAPGQKTGQINCTPGNKMASYDQFQIAFRGRGGHGAMPQLAVNPIYPAARLAQALPELVSGECAPGSGAVLSVCSFQSGTASNIIPEEAVIAGTFRTADSTDREHLRMRIPQVADHLASASRTEVQVELPEGLPVLRNDPELCRQIAAYLASVLGEDMVSTQPQRLSASEDFSLVAKQVPTLYMTIGTGTPEDGYCYGNHNPKVLYDEKALPFGAAAYAAAALAMLG